MSTKRRLTAIVDELGVFTVIIDKEVYEPIDSKDARSSRKYQDHELHGVSYSTQLQVSLVRLCGWVESEIE